METGHGVVGSSHSLTRLCSMSMETVNNSNNLQLFGFKLVQVGNSFYIVTVDTGSPAALAGLRILDRILEVDGIKIENRYQKVKGQLAKRCYTDYKVAVGGTLNLLVINAEDERLHSNEGFNKLFKNDISTLLESSAHSDVTLVSDSGRKWELHRCILGARSPVFAAMFSSDFLEKRSREISVKEVQDAELDLMIRDIYGSLASTQLSGMEKELLLLADRFQITTLKKTCEVLLIDNISNENAFELFLFADKHDAQALRKCAKITASKNLRLICRTAEWKKLLKEDSDLANELITNSFEKKF